MISPKQRRWLTLNAQQHSHWNYSKQQLSQVDLHCFPPWSYHMINIVFTIGQKTKKKFTLFVVFRLTKPVKEVVRIETVAIYLRENLLRTELKKIVINIMKFEIKITIKISMCEQNLDNSFGSNWLWFVKWKTTIYFSNVIDCDC